MFYCSTDGTQGEGTAGGYPAGGSTTDQCGFEANTEGSTLYLKICVYNFFQRIAPVKFGSLQYWCK